MDSCYEKTNISDTDSDSDSSSCASLCKTLIGSNNIPHYDPETNQWLESLQKHSSLRRIKSDYYKPRKTIVSDIDWSKHLSVDSSLKLQVSNTQKFIKLIDTVDRWDFDIFELEEMSIKGTILQNMAIIVILKLGLVDRLTLNKHGLSLFLSEIEGKYFNNSYHNAIHAAEVLHSCYFFINPTGGNLRDMLSDIDVLSVVIGAIIHDVGHTGQNNTFHIKTESPFAIRYNDQSVLENNSLNITFKIMDIPTAYPFTKFSDRAWRELRSNIITMVLSTDMAKHNEFVAVFKSALSSSGAKTLESTRSLITSGHISHLSLIEVILKASDISGCIKNNYFNWAHRIHEEFFAQREYEIKAGIEMSNTRDVSIQKSQLNFITYMVTPLFELLLSFVDYEIRSHITKRIGDVKESWTHIP